MKAVKFAMPHTVGSLYNEGEIAGFEDDVADDLIERKIAVEVKVKAKSGAKAPPTEAELDDMSDSDIDALIVERKIKLADSADRAAKIAALKK